MIINVPGRARVAVLVLVFLTAGCAGDGDAMDAAAEDDAVVDTTPDKPADEVEEQAPAEDEPATEEPGDDEPATEEPADEAPAAGTDLEDGRHATYLHAIDVGNRTLTVDVIQFLTGQAATDAYHADHPDDPDGPPNDYYIVNVNPRLRTLAVASDVAVTLVRLHEDGDADLDPGTWEELPDYLAVNRPEDDRLSWNPFWVTLEAGTVTAMEEQYLP